jgi:hypothetical protein
MLTTCIYHMTFCTAPFDAFVAIQIRQAMHSMYNVTMTRVRVTIVAVEKQ